MSALETCHLGGLPDRCPMCRKPHNAAEAALMLADRVSRVIALIRAERRAERDGAAT